MKWKNILSVLVVTLIVGGIVWANDYYTHGSFPAPGSPATSAGMRAELDLISAGFDKLPSFSGNANKPVIINGSATGLSVTTGTLTLPGNFALSGANSVTLTSTGATNVTLPTTGILATLAGSETLTTKTFNLANNTLSGTRAQFNAALSDDDFATLDGSESLSNKTVVAPVLSGTVTGTYTLGGTPSISGAAITNSNFFGGYSFGGSPTLGAVLLGNSQDIVGLDELAFNDLGAASVTGRLRRNSATLTWHDGTAARNILTSASPTVTTGPLTMTSGQIAFPATQAASGDANTLDDYEEGTWTPSVGGTATYTTQTGTYTKIGNLVTVTCRLQINAIGTGSATTISGLPFTSAQANTGALYWSSAGVTPVYAVAVVNAAGNTVVLNGIGAAGATLAPINILGSGTLVIFTLTYAV